MEDFLKQMVAIEQSRVDREDKWLESHRYISNQKPLSEKFVKPLEKENCHAIKDTPYRGRETELKKADFTQNYDKPQPYTRDLKTEECFRCGKKRTHEKRLSCQDGSS